MSLRARINSPEEKGGRGEDGHLVASYRAKLLEEIDLAEMSSLAAAERRASRPRSVGAPHVPSSGQRVAPARPP